MATRNTSPAPQLAAGERANTEGFATKEAEANVIIRQNLLWGAGAGVLPPLIDVVAITAVQIKLLRQLAALYEIDFKEDRVKSILTALAAGLGAPFIGMNIALGAFRFIPVLGPLISALAVPGVATAFTYAVGKIFVQHFASGGTFLDFDPDKVKQHFARQFEEGKLVASKLRTEPVPAKEA